MTLDERIVVSAYTGVLMCEFKDLFKYIEKIMDRQLQTIELAKQSTWKEIKEKSKNDFLKLCEGEEINLNLQERKMP